jgi:orotate phosphoribosyltransferase
MAFNQNEFNDFIVNNDVVGFFSEPIKLKSGRMSNWYVNWRTPTSDAYLMDRLTDFVLEFTKEKGLEPDCFYGVPEGATKLGVLTQFKYAKSSDGFAPGSHVLPMGRGKPKEHGAPKDKFFVGQPKGKVIVLEDVTTTGGSLLTTLDNLKESGVDVIAAFGLTNRMEVRDHGLSVKDAVKQKGISYHALSNALDLLPAVYKKSDPGEHIAKSIEEEFEKFGVEKLKLI